VGRKYSVVRPKASSFIGCFANVVYGEITVKTRPTGSALPVPEAENRPIHKSNDPKAALIERVISSTQFRSSLRLREFLLYIADCALKETPEAATEQQIGVHVFGRLPGYNSSEDSIVRTHARLLRQKLAEYFNTEGVDEPLILEVPKGHYLPIFRARESAPPQVPFAVPPEPAPALPPAPLPQTPRGWNPLIGGIALGVLLALLGLGAFLLARPAKWTAVAKTPVEVFWAPFFNGDPPIVIYSNARFLGDSKTGLRYAPSGVDPAGQPLVDNYTGIGELASVYELTRLFDDHHADFVLKRSLLVTWDEAKQRNLIFIGSTAENPSLKALPSLADFTLVAKQDSAGFVNLHPLPGEPALFSRPEHPLTMDYAVIALVPGVEAGKHTLMFSGLTTLGTQAAVEFAARKDTLGELFKAVPRVNGEMRPFEAVLAVTLEGGVPLQSKLVSVHVH
jgi:hypothetical protein